MAYGTVQKVAPKITRVSVSSTETSHTFTAQMRAFTVRCQETEELRCSWESGETSDSSDYLTLYVGDTWWEEDVAPIGSEWVLYLRAPNASGSVGVTVMEWY